VVPALGNRPADADPRQSGAMLREVKGNPSVTSPAAVELIAASERERPDPPPEARAAARQDAPVGSTIDTYA
jgi:hypothetical protein